MYPPLLSSFGQLTKQSLLFLPTTPSRSAKARAFFKKGRRRLNIAHFILTSEQDRGISACYWGNQLRLPRPNSDWLVETVSPRKRACVFPGWSGQEIAYLVLESEDAFRKCDGGEEEEDEDEAEDEEGPISPFTHANLLLFPRNGAKTKKMQTKQERFPHLCMRNI